MTATNSHATDSTRERALIALVAALALDNEESLACALTSARAEGFDDEQIARIRAYLAELRAPAPAQEESLSALLADATRSSCC
jgi:cytochrome c553